MRMMKKKTRSSNYLPAEVMERVLVALSPKTLLRFKCVCKAWCSLIDSPDFINDNMLTYNKNSKGKKTIFFYNASGPRVVVRSEDIETATVVEESSYSSRAVFYVNPGEASAYVNGLLILRCIFNDKKLFLWNPSIRKVMYLPPRHSISQYFGLGYDASTNDYKIVAIGEPLNDCYEYGEVNFTLHSTVEVYSLNSHSWKEITDPGLFVSDLSPKFGIFAAGAINWLDSSTAWWRSVCYRIVSFDVHKEVFRYIMLPEPLRHAENPCLEMMGDCLALLDPHQTSVRLWVMEEFGVFESWTRWIKVKIIEADFITVLDFDMNGQLIVLTSVDEKDDRKSCNMMNGHVTDLTPDLTPDGWRAYIKCPFVESLALGSGAATRHIFSDSDLNIGGIL